MDAQKVTKFTKDKRSPKSAERRKAIAQSPVASSAGSFYERARHLIGSINGPGDLSARSKTLEGYGRFRRP